MTTLRELKEMVNEAVAEDFEAYYLDSDDSDTSHDIADGLTPVYTADLLRCALGDLWLAHTEPEFDTENTADGILKANIYNELRDYAYHALTQYRENYEPEPEECPECFGSGEIMDECPDCNGDGRIDLDDPEECPFCQGEGEREDSCFECDGEGVIYP